ncbi:MAG TPA: hypothetical protein VFS24_11050 [Steroidobacteraceae bacterium]|nr:hypothetical protein [Steroidobacteraceae bacterium]
MAKPGSKTPGTLADVLRDNVRHQQQRKEATASPPEARRSPRERVKTAERKRHSNHRAD